VPRHPPRRSFCFSLLIYPPAGAQWGARPGGLSGGFPNPAKLILVRFAKNGLASMQASHFVPRNPRRVQDASSAAPGPRNQPVYRPCGIPILLFPGPRRRPARSLLIYPPAGAQWSPRPGGLGGGFPNPAKLIWVRFAKKGLASMRASNFVPRTPRRVQDARGRSTLYRLPWTAHPRPSTLDRPPRTALPSRLPWTAHPEPPSQAVYPGPPTKTRLPWAARPEPTPQPVYPGPPAPRRPPTRLPWTAHPQPVYPAPPTHRPPKPSTLDRPLGPASQPFQRLALLYSTLNDVLLWISLPKPWLQAPFPFKARQNIAAVPNVQRKRPSY
jgi:hypothetical protein